jgi:UDP:flavonoid glycosyltransferase YjiC (YdhE family)
MRVVIQTLGSRGDVQPFVALGARLRLAGHDVRLATSQAFATMTEAAGIGFAPLRIDFAALMAGQVGRDGVGSVRSAIRAVREVKPLMRGVLDDSLAASEGADLLIYHPKILAGPHIAEKLAIPAMVALPIPALSPTAAFPTPLFDWPALSGATNRLSHRLLLAATMLGYRGMIDRWRAEALDLPPAGSVETSMLSIRGRPVPRLYGFSKALVPRPLDWTGEDHVTGCWFSEPNPEWAPPADLVSFLGSGPEPVYVGFGSMAPGEAAARTAMVVEALDRAGLRGVLGLGWGGLEPQSGVAHVHFVREVPHEWLFPRVCAVVHHGGSGTTHVGLRHGKPTLVCPLFGDQFFWGRRVAILGAGPEPLPMAKLRTDQLHQVVGELVSLESYANAARRVQALMAEDDACDAVRVIEGCACRAASGRERQAPSA